MSVIPACNKTILVLSACLFFCSQLASASGRAPSNGQVATAEQRLDSNLAVALAQLGAYRCVEKANQVVQFFGVNANTVQIIDKPGNNPAAEMIGVTLLVTLEGGVHTSVEVSFAPTPLGCSASYAAMFYTADTCEEAEQRHYQGAQFQPLEETPYRLAMIGTNARVMSRSLPSGCLLIKREVIN